MKKLFFVLLAFVLVWHFVIPVLALPGVLAFAQGDEPMSPDAAFQYLLTALDTITKVAYAASLVLLLTQFIKYGMTKLLPEKYWVSPAALTLGVQVIFWVGHVVTLQLGYGQQYRDALAVIESILKAFQPLLPQTIIVGLSAHAVYNLAHKTRSPGFQMQVRPQKVAA